MTPLGVILLILGINAFLVILFLLWLFVRAMTWHLR